jgi:hypothetical protein
LTSVTSQFHATSRTIPHPYRALRRHIGEPRNLRCILDGRVHLRTYTMRPIQSAAANSACYRSIPKVLNNAKQSIDWLLRFHGQRASPHCQKVLDIKMWRGAPQHHGRTAYPLCYHAESAPHVMTANWHETDELTDAGQPTRR